MSQYAPGWALTISLEPTFEVRERCGLSTSTRNMIKKIWPYQLPNMDPEILAKLVFCFENDPERSDGIISGAQDSIGICVPRLCRHYYNNRFWPEKIETCYDDQILSWLEQHLVMIPMEPRRLGCSVVADKDITEPKVKAYIQSNMIGFYNILEACRHHPVEHLVYASSSSVYGGNKKVPFSTDDRVDNPVSLYAATKKSNELMAHCYSKLYDIPSTGLRFFTVYGPAGRPDMAYFGFTNKLLKGDTIQIFNYGNYAVYNIGGGQPENLLDFVNILQEELVRAGVLPEDFDFEAHKQLVPMQPGDVPTTYADAEALERDYGFTPKITLREGLRKFAEWYKSYYQ